MSYTVDSHLLKVYSQAIEQQPMKHIHKCMEHAVFNIYTINSMLYLHTIKDKYIEIYNKFISQLWIYAKAVRILAKEYFQFC